MFRLIYVSTARELLSKDKLIEILTKAREKNARLGITGMLIYKDGNFMQLLEGEESVVRKLYDTISRDVRHQGLMIVMQKTVSDKMFADWTMGFRDLSDPELLSLPGFAPLRKLDFIHKGASPDVTTCLDILRFFQELR